MYGIKIDTLGYIGLKNLHVSSIQSLSEMENLEVLSLLGTVLNVIENLQSLYLGGNRITAGSTRGIEE